MAQAEPVHSESPPRGLMGSLLKLDKRFESLLKKFGTRNLRNFIEQNEFKRELNNLSRSMRSLDFTGQSLKNIHQRFQLSFSVGTLLDDENFTGFFAFSRAKDMDYSDYDRVFEEALRDCPADQHIDFFRRAAATIQDNYSKRTSERYFRKLLMYSSEDVIRRRQKNPFQVAFEMYDRILRLLLSKMNGTVAPARDGHLFEAKKQEIARFVGSFRLELHAKIKKYQIKDEVMEIL